ncbi:hypothetical protein CPB84DRAFT_1842986 [Gymnopilus junonius]|uniref:Uncharacterized protein n=1 Tax=Gymnopilus junonius TaxID=109634 RepID=A0A9P5NX58_GYMJU|nr:hypothetical protein CPB84DRAFT_1842986 [Gymnopilus junonius]
MSRIAWLKSELAVTSCEYRRPPSYAFVTRVYRRNLRPIVLSFAVLGGLWALFSGVCRPFFCGAAALNTSEDWLFPERVHYKSSDHAGKLSLFSIVIGILYMVVFAIELFAFIGTSPNTISPLVRLPSGLVVLIIAAVGLLQVVIHFTLKNDIINTCADVATGSTVFIGSIFGPVSAGTLDPIDARDWCNREWNRASFGDIIAFLITTFLAGFFCVIAFSYLRQVLDPAHPANVIRGPATHRMDNFPSHYNPPYNPNFNNYPSYPAPAGPPPSQSTDAFVPPYDGDGKPPDMFVVMISRAHTERRIRVATRRI